MRVDVQDLRVLVPEDPECADWVRDHLGGRLCVEVVPHPHSTQALQPDQERAARFGRAFLAAALADPFVPALVLDPACEFVEGLPVDGWEVPDGADALLLGANHLTYHPFTGAASGIAALRRPEAGLFRVLGTPSLHATAVLTRRFALFLYTACLRAVGEPGVPAEAWMALSCPHFRVYAPRRLPCGLAPSCDPDRRALADPERWAELGEVREPGLFERPVIRSPPLATNARLSAMQATASDTLAELLPLASVRMPEAALVGLL